MILFQDSRQKLGRHDMKNRYWLGKRVPVWGAQLPVGDYMTADEHDLRRRGESAIDVHAMFGWVSFDPKCSVDTKASIHEIAGNLVTDHERFRAECENAQSLGIQLVVLVENDEGVQRLSDLEQWRESARDFRARGGKKPYDGAQLVKMMRTMHERYGVVWSFCTPEEAGRKVLRILASFEEGGYVC